jgi:hypothetical protein
LLPHRSSFRRNIRARSGHGEFFRNLLEGHCSTRVVACLHKEITCLDFVQSRSNITDAIGLNIGRTCRI